MPAADPESLRETEFWRAKPDIHESIAEAREEIASGNTVSNAELRRRLGRPED